MTFPYFQKDFDFEASTLASPVQEVGLCFLLLSLSELILFQEAFNDTLAVEAVAEAGKAAASDQLTSVRMFSRKKSAAAKKAFPPKDGSGNKASHAKEATEKAAEIGGELAPAGDSFADHCIAHHVQPHL